MTTHLVIPDTQAKPGVPTAHLGWIGQYIVDKKPDIVVHLGDHWDFPSLSFWDKGKKKMEGQRYSADVAAGNEALAILDAPLHAHNANRRTVQKRAGYEPRRVLLRGNHEERLTRAVEADAKLEGALSFDDLESPGWEVHDFLEPVDIDGVVYAHYFYQPMTGNPYAGTIENRLKNIGHTFTMGHQQTLLYGQRYVGGKSQHGLIAGACYLHDEDYKGPQGNAHWRGVIMKHEVENGSYDPMFVSLNYLCRRYEGVSLAEFQSKI